MIDFLDTVVMGYVAFLMIAAWQVVILSAVTAVCMGIQKLWKEALK